MKKLLVVMLLAAGMMACEDIIERDISNSTITILTPADNAVGSTFHQLFKWEPLKGALKYQLQIVRPSFANIQYFILDTTIEQEEFSYTLQPGSYQWRIRAKNGSSSSAYQLYNLSIDSTLNLAGQTVFLLSPADNFSTNQFTRNFSWEAMPNANSYIFQVLYGGSQIYSTSLTTTNVNYIFSVAGTYQWRVSAQNDVSNSAPSQRTIIIDDSIPAAPVLIHPLASDTASNPVLLSWSRDPSAIHDSLFIFADSTLTVLLKDTLTTSQTYYFYGTANQDYFWRVRSGDAAGNWGPFCYRRKFIVNP